MIDTCLLVVAAAASAVADGFGERCRFLRDHSGRTSASCAGGAVDKPRLLAPLTIRDACGVAWGRRHQCVLSRSDVDKPPALTRHRAGVMRDDRDHCGQLLSALTRAWADADGGETSASSPS